MTKKENTNSKTKATNNAQKTFTVPTLDFSKLSKVILQDLNNPENKKGQSFFRKYSREDVIKYLEKPQNYSKQIRSMSEYLYIASQQYRRLINYLSKIYLMAYVIEPYYINHSNLNERTFTTTYNNLTLEVENMSLKHELIKLQVEAWKSDVVYAYVHRTKDSYYFQILPADYCEITSVVNGCYVYSFDFSYFNGKKDDFFNQYPEEFKSLYANYKANKNLRWQEINSDNCFCLKIQEDLDYPLAPFCSVFAALYDIDEYKSLQKTKTALGAYSLLAMTLPLAKDGDATNPYLIDPEEVRKYYNFIASILPPEIGILLSPTPLETIQFKDEKDQVNRVSESSSQFWNESGISELIFSAADGTGASLAKSIMTDEALSWSLIQQIQRNVNRLIDKFNSADYKFKVEFLNVTIFNWSDMYDKYINAATYGMPTKLKAGAILGFSPSSFNNMLYLENTVLGLDKTMTPMQSSNTLSSDSNGGGRPKKKSDSKSKSGEKTDKVGANDKENRKYSIDLDLDEIVE